MPLVATIWQQNFIIHKKRAIWFPMKSDSSFSIQNIRRILCLLGTQQKYLFEGCGISRGNHLECRYKGQIFHRNSRWKVHACEKTVLALCICFCYNDLVNYLTWLDGAFAAQLWIFSAIGLSARLWLIQMKKPAAGTNALPLAFCAEGYAQILHFVQGSSVAAQVFPAGETCSHSASRCSAGMRYSGLTW